MVQLLLPWYTSPNWRPRRQAKVAALSKDWARVTYRRIDEATVPIPLTTKRHSDGLLPPARQDCGTYRVVVEDGGLSMGHETGEQTVLYTLDATSVRRPSVQCCNGR